MNDKCKAAIESLRKRAMAFYDAENDAVETLKLVLAPAGENGCSVAMEDETDGIYIAVAECNPQKFEPITAIRFWKGQLEVFVSMYRDSKTCGWTLLGGGRWVKYEDAQVDTWFMLDLVSTNIEYSDGYQD